MRVGLPPLAIQPSSAIEGVARAMRRRVEGVVRRFISGMNYSVAFVWELTSFVGGSESRWKLQLCLFEGERWMLNSGFGHYGGDEVGGGDIESGIVDWAVFWCYLHSFDLCDF